MASATTTTEFIGKGSFGSVSVWDRDHAVKSMPLDFVDGATVRAGDFMPSITLEYLVMKAAELAKSDKVMTAKTYSFPSDGTVCLYMPLCGSNVMRAVGNIGVRSPTIRSYGALVIKDTITMATVKFLMAHMLDCVREYHEIMHHKFPHYDIKLDNFVLYRTGDETVGCKLIDFSISHAACGTWDNQVVTITYRPPEYFGHRKPPLEDRNTKVDSWSMGMCFLFLMGFGDWFQTCYMCCPISNSDAEEVLAYLLDRLLWPLVDHYARALRGEGPVSYPDPRPVFVPGAAPNQRSIPSDARSWYRRAETRFKAVSAGRSWGDVANRWSAGRYCVPRAFAEANPRAMLFLADAMNFDCRQRLTVSELCAKYADVFWDLTPAETMLANSVLYDAAGSFSDKCTSTICIPSANSALASDVINVDVDITDVINVDVDITDVDVDDNDDIKAMDDDELTRGLTHFDIYLMSCKWALSEKHCAMFGTELRAYYLSVVYSFYMSVPQTIQTALFEKYSAREVVVALLFVCDAIRENMSAMESYAMALVRALQIKKTSLSKCMALILDIIGLCIQYVPWIENVDLNTVQAEHLAWLDTPLPLPPTTAKRERVITPLISESVASSPLRRRVSIEDICSEDNDFVTTIPKVLSICRKQQ